MPITTQQNKCLHFSSSWGLEIYFIGLRPRLKFKIATETSHKLLTCSYCTSCEAVDHDVTSQWSRWWRHRRRYCCCWGAEVETSGWRSVTSRFVWVCSSRRLSLPLFSVCPIRRQAAVLSWLFRVYRNSLFVRFTLLSLKSFNAILPSSSTSLSSLQHRHFIYGARNSPGKMCKAVADPGFAKGVESADHGERAEREPKRGLSVC